MGGEPSGPQGTAAARRPVTAVGFVAAMAVATPAPTLAQGVYVGPGGVDLATVNIIVGITIMPMTGATGAAGR